MTKLATALVAVFLCVVAVAMLTSRGAYAHSWYSRTNCCSGNDCAPVPLDSSWVTMEQHGYQVTLTLAQAKLVNPNAQFPINVFIPYTNNKIKAPPILKPGETYGPNIYHLCIPASYVGVYCLFVAPGA